MMASTPRSRYCWTSDQITLWIEDVPNGDGTRRIDVRARAYGELLRLDIEVIRDCYHVQDLKGAPNHDLFERGKGGQGFGTLIANAAFAYAISLADPDVPFVRGVLSTDGDHRGTATQEERAARRERFAARFGLVAQSEVAFRVPLSALAPVDTYQVAGHPMHFVPFTSFQSCTHKHV